MYACVIESVCKLNRERVRMCVREREGVGGAL